GTDRQTCSLNWGTSGAWPRGTCGPQGKDPPTKTISRRERPRVSDEAIVSDDATGQNNPTPSQGPLDRRAWTEPAVTPPQRGDCPQGLKVQGLKGLLAAYKSRLCRDEDGGGPIRFEAVLGKT